MIFDGAAPLVRLAVRAADLTNEALAATLPGKPRFTFVCTH